MDHRPSKIKAEIRGPLTLSSRFLHDRGSRPQTAGIPCTIRSLLDSVPAFQYSFPPCPSPRRGPGSPYGEENSTRRVGGDDAFAVDFCAGTADVGRALRPQGEPLEPEDAALHPRQEESDPYHRRPRDHQGPRPRVALPSEACGP